MGTRIAAVVGVVAISISINAFVIIVIATATATATTTATTTTTTTTNQQGVPSSPPCALSWTCTGQMAGSVWMQLETDQKRISQKVIAPSRSMGPLLALASVQTDNRCLETRAPSPTTTTTTNEKTQNGHQQKQAQSQAQAQEHNHYQRYHQHSLQEMTAEVVRHLGSNPALFSERLDRAFRVWKDCVQCTWKNRLSSSDYEGLQNRIRENRLRFRLSCVRVEPIVVPSSFSRKKKKKLNAMPELFSYSRKDLCRAIMEACGPELVPNFFNQYTNRIRHSKEISSNNNISSSSSNNDEEKETSVSTDSKSEEGSGRWTVDLDKFDIELVVFIVPPDPRSKNGKLAFGISLRPHSFLQSRSFETGQIPRDVTAPYLGGEILSQGIVRLRPTTAHLLLQIANLQPYDVVLDPCAGIGTIPVEAEQYQACFETSTAGRIGPSEKKKQYLAIGGDLVLNNPKYTRIAGIMEHANGYTVGSGNSNRSSSLLVAWDAAQLPMRTSCVDVAVSDLPFGQQCLSVNALNQLLPLIFLECARVLRPNTGRMIMLAGGSPIAVVANMEKLSGKYWKKPIPRVSPVSIGGILAWIIVGIRNETPFDRNIVPKQLTLVRKIAEKRDRINRQRNSESGEQQRDKRRRKTND